MQPPCTPPRTPDPFAALTLHRILNGATRAKLALPPSMFAQGERGLTPRRTIASAAR
jgi:hypothetical protein